MNSDEWTIILLAEKTSCISYMETTQQKGWNCQIMASITYKINTPYETPEWI